MALEQLNSPVSNSQLVRQLEGGLPSFRFTPFIEKEFRDFQQQRIRAGRRPALTATLIFALAITSLASLLGATPVGAFPGVVPIAILGLLISLIPLGMSVDSLKHYYQAFAATSIAIAGASAIYLAQIATLNGSGFLLGGAAIAAFGASYVLGLRPRVAICAR